MDLQFTGGFAVYRWICSLPADLQFAIIQQFAGAASCDPNSHAAFTIAAELPISEFEMGSFPYWLLANYPCQS